MPSEEPRLQETPIDPALPIEDTGLPADIVTKIESYHEEAIRIADFGTYMSMIGKIIKELGLNPDTDFPKVAALLNNFRLARNKKPL